MRDLTADERAIVAGGWFVDEYEEENYNQSGRRYGITMINGEVIVPGKKMPIKLSMLGFWETGETGSANDGGGGGGETDNTPDVRDVTCIDLKPKVADLKAMHQLAVTVAALAKGWDSTYKSMGLEPPEYAVLMYTLPGDSTVYASNRADGKVDEIPNEKWYDVLEKMPAGALIVGVWHSHPGSALPSGFRDSSGGGDWGFMKNLWDGKIGEWPFTLRVDSNALMYITNNEGKTYVFDKSDYNRDGGVASGSNACPVNRGG